MRKNRRDFTVAALKTGGSMLVGVVSISFVGCNQGSNPMGPTPIHEPIPLNSSDVFHGQYKAETAVSLWAALNNFGFKPRLRNGLIYEMLSLPESSVPFGWYIQVQGLGHMDKPVQNYQLAANQWFAVYHRTRRG